MVAACPFPTRQGTQVLIRHLASALAYAGHEVHLITYGYGEYEDEFPFHIHRCARLGSTLRSGPNLMKPVADASLILTARRVIKAHKCDVIHVHNVEGLGIGAVLKMQTGLPLVYHAHNAMGPELPTYFRTHFAQAFASVVGDVIDKTLPRAADALVTFDKDHKALHEIHGIVGSRIHVVPPGLLGHELARGGKEITSSLRARLGEGPWILYAGNPDAYQNLGLLWQSFRKVRAKRPDAKLLIATNYESKVFDQELNAQGDRDGIVVYPYRSLDELRALFALSTLGVCPRKLWTGAPIKILNYMSVGLPIVACKASGRHIVSDACGELVDPNPESFAEGILNVLKGGVRRATVKKSYGRFRLEHQLELYEQVYLKVLTKRSGS